ncbi:tripartite ATP-independent transporter DctM subunit [Wenyingzhuangia heitensis]|uniref:Tripartite ATP-independent transporter DctM subunit n=1 Tax=Wenyingzhuangia heitensis TaxID=1487859 RepID=A0ABX0UCY7_9FLAO|nr:TRAP transporter large permease [Wenyingzhuangia heitensis]NIJ46248.1 tripartite ATP-independent transporter DctM subunit [Wenyingzhuangia heitensis]
MSIAVIGVITLFVILFALLLLKVPVSYSVGIATTVTLLISLPWLPAVTTIMQQMTTGIDSFALLAIPFFILAGDIMNSGGIANRLVNFSKSLVGSFPGGLLYVNIISAMFFGAVSGSAAASASAIGGILAKRMEKENYPKPFSASLNITSSTVGLIIPPSNVLIVFALASAGAASVEALFLAGYLPGILLGLAFITWAAIVAVKRKFPKEERVPFKQLWNDFRRAVLSILMIIVVVGGIVFGVFTATEGAVIAVVYALVLSFVYQEIKVKDLGAVIVKSSKTVAVVMFLISTSMALSWLFAYNEIPQMISGFMLSNFDSPIFMLLAINITLLIVGTFMDMTPAVLIFTPIFLPIVTQIGMDPVHFGIVMVLNLCIGLCTPPVGTLLFIGSGVAGVEVSKVIKPLLPFLAVMVFVLLLVTFIPGISMFLPNLFGK